MKTKITIKNVLKNAVVAFMILFGSNVKAQTIVYDETTSSGIFFQGTDGAEVANPVSDAVNSSATVARSATDGTWQQIQYFPTYSPVSGDKLYFSVYNPNGAGPGQIKFNVQTTELWGGNITYESGSLTGWVEYSIDITSHVGTELTQIVIMPAGDSSSAVYVDNIYFGSTSTLSTSSVTQIRNRAYISREGRIHFAKDQSNTKLSVYDITGRLILEENINGKTGQKALNHKGIYILKIQSDNGVSTQKSVYY